MMAADDKNNKRIRKNDDEGEYPFVQARQTVGGHEVIFNSTKDKESWRHFNPSGTFTNVDKDGRKTHLVADHEYHTTSNGHTRTIEGAKDLLTLKGTRISEMKGSHTEHGEDVTHGSHGSMVTAYHGSTYNHSTGHSEHTSSGHFSDHDSPEGGYRYSNSKEKRMDVSGDRYTVVGGEHGTFVQGNHDVHSTKKMRHHSDSDGKVSTKAKLNIESDSDMTIKSDSKITIQVGSSTIVITSSKISIESSTIEIKATGTLSIDGHPVNVNGGGISTVPFTVP